MKKYLLTAGALLLWSGTALAGGAETVTMPAEAYKAIMEKLDALQKRVDVLEEGGKAAPAPAPAAAVSRAEYDKLSKDIGNIYDTLDEVETKTLRDRINWGAELRTRVDNYKLSELGPSDVQIKPNNAYMPGVAGSFPMELVPMDGDDNDDNNWTNRVRLNMDAKINDTLSFHGRMAVYKNWGDSDYTTTSLYNDLNRVHRPEASGVKLDRAYIDWVPDFIVPVAVTVGRHPSTEGPPLEYKENRQRQSTYPGLLFDTENDGIVVTFGLERYTGLKNAGWRFAYGKGYHSDSDDSSSFSFFDDENDASDTNMYATFLESEIPCLDNSLMVLSYAHMTELPSSFLGSDSPINVGDMDLYGIHMQASNFLNSRFDIFASWAANKSDGNGKFVDFSPYVGTAIPTMGLLSTDGTEDRTGSSIFAGLRYTVPFTPLRDPKIGFEYNHGSKYWMSMTMASTEMFNKLATRGDAYEFYYIQPVNENLFFRAGYTFIDYAYTGSGSHLGQPAETDAELDNYYLLMDVRF
ncbi:MAG: putative porin [Deltaproteobacteria bacterium]|nr:putative porin [Deltaproteobacteria bacterium]